MFASIRTVHKFLKSEHYHKCQAGFIDNMVHQQFLKSLESSEVWRMCEFVQDTWLVLVLFS